MEYRGSYHHDTFTNVWHRQNTIQFCLKTGLRWVYCLILTTCRISEILTKPTASKIHVLDSLLTRQIRFKTVLYICILCPIVTLVMAIVTIPTTKSILANVSHWNNMDTAVIQPSKAFNFISKWLKLESFWLIFLSQYGDITILLKTYQWLKLDFKTVLYTILPVFHPWTVGFHYHSCVHLSQSFTESDIICLEFKKNCGL